MSFIFVSGVIYQVRRVRLPRSEEQPASSVYCIWLSRDPAELTALQNSRSNAARNSRSHLSSLTDDDVGGSDVCIVDTEERVLLGDITNQTRHVAPNDDVTAKATSQVRTKLRDASGKLAVGRQRSRYADAYEDLREIGKGAFGTVMLAVERSTNTEVRLYFHVYYP